ncbi:MAG TPA: hypothetical protein VK550_09115 [Polyangiaceae bacterium]|nr:hypothetical protein [Polyangiaceae bacterium]
MPSSLHRQLLGHVLAALGLGSTFVALTGCDSDVTDAGNSLGDAAAEPSSTPIDASQSDAPGKPPIIVIVTPPTSDADIDAGRYCRALVISRDSTPENVLCPSADAGDAAIPGRRTRACLPAPPRGQSCSDTYGESCILNTYSCGLATYAQRVLCGPLSGPADTCCYITEGSCPVGRPFVVSGVARLAPAANEATWAVSLQPDVATLDGATRAALAEVWIREGLAEHASVASFARFVLQCLTVGAPADIVQGAQQACADEIEHARIAFGLATAYAGHSVGPGPLAVAGALDETLDAADIACSVAAEGCIAELVSASLIAAARDAARDTVVKATLARTAEQELAHALLAWRYLAWAFRAGDTRLRDRVARVFDRAHQHIGFGAQTSLPADLDRMRAHGYLAVDERRRIANAVLADVIRPAAHALFAAPRRDEARPAARVT